MKPVFEISFKRRNGGDLAIFTTGEFDDIGKADGSGGAATLSDPAGDIATTLPEEFDAAEFHQFRFTKIGNLITAAMENFSLGKFKTDAGPVTPAVSAINSKIELDMVRLTYL